VKQARDKGVSVALMWCGNTTVHLGLRYYAKIRDIYCNVRPTRRTRPMHSNASHLISPLSAGQNCRA